MSRRQGRISNRDNARSGQAADREDINRQAGSKGQAANGQSKYAVQVNTGNQKTGENKTSHWVSVCVLLLCE